MAKITKIVEIANDDEDIDDDAFDSESGGIEDLDGLRAVARLAKLVGSLPWFSTVGRPLTPALLRDAEGYVAGLGFPGIGIAGVEDWLAASNAAQAPDWGDDWWQAEEQMRKSLLDDALQLNPEHDLMVALEHVSTRASETAHDRAAASAAKQGVSDPALIQVAAGAAAQAAYQAALVLAADADSDHPFALKFRLFEAGRLPLGITGNTFNLF
ncbi:hypothetical protein [Ferrovibrio sp.]|uniref:hypothetical protein n=1 Tax=Ferrovibrio sp. TaxID=1917215 RepID=UPI002625C997|nr:hypothetical protein [Ferrovibrio sp.]